MYYALIIQQNHIKHFEFVSFVIDQLMLFKHLLKNWKHGKYYIIVKMLLHCPVQMKGTHIINIDWNLIISAPNTCAGFCLPHTQDDGLVFLWSLMWHVCVCVGFTVFSWDMRHTSSDAGSDREQRDERGLAKCTYTLA